jgi:hypothetical protein
MKYGMEVADAWLHSLSSAWKRAALFWSFVAGVGWASAWLLSGYGAAWALAQVLKLGGFSYVIQGPVCIWSVVVAAVTWVRFVHLETAGIRAFLLLGTLIAINGWSSGWFALEWWKFAGFQVLAMGLIAAAVFWKREGEREPG